MGAAHDTARKTAIFKIRLLIPQKPPQPAIVLLAIWLGAPIHGWFFPVPQFWRSYTPIRLPATQVFLMATDWMAEAAVPQFQMRTPYACPPTAQTLSILMSYAAR